VAETMQALVWQGGDKVAVAEVPAPTPRDGWALVDVAFNGVCGTDLHIAAGEHPRAQPGLILGHEFVGALAVGVAGLAAGTPVAVEPLLADGTCRPCRSGRAHVCDDLRLLGIDVPGGAAERVAVPFERLLPLPAEIDLRRAAFVEPLAVAVHAVRRSRLTLGEPVLVAGAGPIGQAVSVCARLAGASVVYVAEPAPARRRVAEEFGAELLDPDDPGADLGRRTGGDGVPVVFDTAAHPAVAAGATAWASAGGRVVVVGAYSQPPPVNLQAVMFRELEMIGCRVYTREDMVAALALLATGRFDPDPLITSVVGLDEAPQALERLRSGDELKVLIKGRRS
jgi:(R,R)-butanediol dehydrogenase/meso-butanediol dehydrogenase/diacetyl reductase